MRLVLLLVLCLALAASAGAQEGVSTAIVPVVGTAFGPGVLWKTDVEIINDTGSEADVAMELTMAPDSPAILFSLGPGDTQRFPDVIGQAFGLNLAVSPLRVTMSTRRPLTIRATVYGLKGTDVSAPQPIAVYSGQQYYPLRALDGLAFSEELRTNIGLVNFGDRDAEFILALQRLPGRNLAITRIVIAAGTIAHLSIQSLFPLISSGTDFTVVVETAARDTFIYASVIDNDHAGRFIAPRVTTR